MGRKVLCVILLAAIVMAPLMAVLDARPAVAMGRREKVALGIVAVLGLVAIIANNSDSDCCYDRPPEWDRAPRYWDRPGPPPPPPPPHHWRHHQPPPRRYEWDHRPAHHRSGPKRPPAPAK